jgi:hypothetical protein
MSSSLAREAIELFNDDNDAGLFSYRLIVVIPQVYRAKFDTIVKLSLLNNM